MTDSTSEANLPASFSELGLLPDLLRAVTDEGYTKPTPIQARAIPAVLARRDIMGSAQTGTGKTASFALPILQLLFPHASTSPSPARHPVRALVLTPTRELAVQVEESFRTYGRHVPLRTCVVYGGVDMNPQIRQLHGGVEIVVATPGRLLDHVRNRTIMLSRVEILVLDEADRMLDMGFMPDLKRILAELPSQRQNLLFSATFSDEIRRLADELLNKPVLIEVARRNTAAETIQHHAYLVDDARKSKLLVHLVASRDLRQVLVFARTRLGTNRLARYLDREGLNAAAIHSNRTQLEREKALADFKSGAVRVLVATDVASRGLDIEDLPIVVNYELPSSPEDYVHRIGRTGRAGSSGEAISLVAPEEDRMLQDIEKLLGRPIERDSVPGYGRGAASDLRPRSDERPEAPPRRERSPRAESVRSRPREERTVHERRRDEPEQRRREELPRPDVWQAPPEKPAAPGGFDFDKPYEPAQNPGSSAEGGPGEHPRKPRRQTAVLLGGDPRK